MVMVQVQLGTLHTAYPAGCHIDPGWEWQTNRLIRTASCEAGWSNKFWNRKTHGWFRSHFHLTK